MTLFVDASAMVSILAKESDWLALSRTAIRAERLITSAVAVWETVTALHRNHEFPLDLARELMNDLLERYEIRVVALDEQTASLALDAFERFGKGNHPARLNMGDCFAYACAKANGAKLLYKGDDFALTDLA